MNDRISVYTEGSRTPVVLTSNDHLATGGEGAVYLKGDRVFKVFLDPSNAVARGIEQKVQLLKNFRNPGIASPQSVLRNKGGDVVGILLPLVKGEPLCKLYTNNWRDAHQFAGPQTIQTVDRMREILRYAHDQSALMVDGNELNWLVDGTTPVAIDVDSWALPGFPATAIMPSIRDYGSNAFNEETDWFAWAIVTFQLWTGIHPYKGTHPLFARGALADRMKARASVFDAGVKLPAAARSVFEIPPRLLGWYEQMFQSANRSVPPLATASVVAPQVAPKLKVIQSSTASLKIERIGSMDGTIVATSNGFVIVRKRDQLTLWDAVVRAPVAKAKSEDLKLVLQDLGCLVRLPGLRIILTVAAAGCTVQAFDLDNGHATTSMVTADRLWQARNRAFGLTKGVSNGLGELDVGYVGDRLMVSQKQRWPASVLSTKFMRNVFVQDCLGAHLIGVMTEAGLIQGVAAALKGYRIVEGFAPDEFNVWLTAIRTSDGESVRLKFVYVRDRFEKELEFVASDLQLDAAMTSSGVAVVRDGATLIGSKGQAARIMSCAGVSDSLRLFSAGSTIAAFEDTQVLSIRLV